MTIEVVSHITTQKSFYPRTYSVVKSIQKPDLSESQDIVIKYYFGKRKSPPYKKYWSTSLNLLKYQK